MWVGTAHLHITPSPSADLGGYLARVQPSVGIHDELSAYGLYLNDGGSRLLWLHADLFGLERAFAVELKTVITEQTGLQPHEVIVSATHTHSGPATVHMLNCGEGDPCYLEWLQERLLETALAARAHPAEAEPVYAEGRCGLALDRRGGPDAHTEDRLGVVAWRRAGGAYVAVLANYGMHNVALGSANRFVSGDVAGRAARQIAAQLPGNPSVLFTNGAAGNLNPPGIGEDFAPVDAWGDQLAQNATAALAHAAPLASSSLSSAHRVVDMPFVRPQAADIEEIAQRARAKIVGRTEYVTRRYADAFERWQRHMKAAAGTPAARAAPLEIQAATIGSLTFVGFGAEVFSTMTGELRARTGRTIHVVGYANGLLGYIAPRSAHEAGGYETERAFIFYDTPPLDPGAFDLARDAAVDLVRTSCPS